MLGKERIPLRLANTLSHELEKFVPIFEKEVGLYTCGPTVYLRAHIGNLRAYIFSDTLKRTLKFMGYNVKHVMNVTDVGHLTSDADEGPDKVQVSAQKERITAWEISRKYTKMFLTDIERVNIIPPDILCRATDHIPEQIELIKRLVGKGYTYITSDGIYFDTSKLGDYGKMARLDIEGLVAGKRVEMGEKKNVTDFALWKFSRPGEKRDMEWNSPWGVGFPGWHIECSAMAMKYLGEQFDIHTGGIDHIPVHHPNEIAQSESATGKKPFVRYWLHSEFLVASGGEKMSKSLGNIMDLDALEAQGIEPLAYRYYCLNGNYGSKLTLGDASLRGAQAAFDTLRATIINIRERMQREPDVGLSERGNQYLADFTNVVANNLNTPRGLAALWTMLKDGALSCTERYHLAIRFDVVLGLRMDSFMPKVDENKISDEVLALVVERQISRDQKDWNRADLLRNQVKERGYDLFDTPQGLVIKKTQKLHKI